MFGSKHAMFNNAFLNFSGSNKECVQTQTALFVMKMRVLFCLFLSLRVTSALDINLATDFLEEKNLNTVTVLDCFTKKKGEY